MANEDKIEVDQVGKGEARLRSGFVAIIGAPNAGKSTLTNLLVGTKVSIVTRKVQTTRARLRGIAVYDHCQVVFVDTPGIFEPRRRLDKAMVQAAWGGAAEADIVLMLVDGQRGVNGDVQAIVDQIKNTHGHFILAINKIDLIPRDQLLALTEQLSKEAAFEAVFYISALKGEGTEALIEHIKTHLPAGPWFYPADQLTDAPLRYTAAEVTREKLYERLHDELPYAITVETTDWTEKKDGSVRVDQVIYVERDSQKKIVLGKGGAVIKAISMAARKELGEILDQPVHLFLFVKVRERWGDDPARFREMGLEFPSDK